MSCKKLKLSLIPSLSLRCPPPVKLISARRLASLDPVHVQTAASNSAAFLLRPISPPLLPLLPNTPQSNTLSKVTLNPRRSKTSASSLLLILDPSINTRLLPLLSLCMANTSRKKDEITRRIDLSSLDRRNLNLNLISLRNRTIINTIINRNLQTSITGRLVSIPSLQLIPHLGYHIRSLRIRF